MNIDKVERLIEEVQAVLKEFKLGDSTEDYIKAVGIVRQRRGLDSQIQNVIDSHIAKEVKRLN